MGTYNIVWGTKRCRDVTEYRHQTKESQNLRNQGLLGDKQGLNRKHNRYIQEDTLNTTDKLTRGKTALYIHTWQNHVSCFPLHIEISLYFYENKVSNWIFYFWLLVRQHLPSSLEQNKTNTHKKNHILLSCASTEDVSASTCYLLTGYKLSRILKREFSHSQRHPVHIFSLPNLTGLIPVLTWWLWVHLLAAWDAMWDKDATWHDNRALLNLDLKMVIWDGISWGFLMLYLLVCFFNLNYKTATNDSIM